MRQRIPEPPEAGLINGLRFATQTFRYLEGVQSRYRDAVRIPVPGRPPLVIVTGPSLDHDLLGRPEEFPRVPVQSAAAMIAERGLVQSEGELWRQQRSVMAPGFSGRQVATYANTVCERVERLAEMWHGEGRRSIDLHAEMTALTVRVASEVLMGEDIGSERAEQFYEWMDVAGREFEFGLDVVQPDWFPQRVSAEFEEAAAGIRGLAEELIEGRREALASDGSRSRSGDGDGGGTGPGPGLGSGADPPRDALTLLLQAESRPETTFPPNQIRDEIATLLIAGHETTALSTSYTLSLLSWHPSIRARVREEAERVLGDGPATYDDLDDLEFTGRVYREALRLYPPAWGVFRRTEQDVALGDYRVDAGSAVIVPIWSIHRDGQYFEAPTTFDPDRWARRDPNDVEAYFPFSTGPHACIGRNFALSGATLTIARLVRDFDVDVPETALDDLRVTPTLRPGGGMRADVTPVGE
jgi:cytochrome P450